MILVRNSMLAVALMLSGCVSMGANYDPARVDSLQPGMGRAQVVAVLGRPTTSVILADGSQHLMWVHSRGTMLGRGDARSVTLLFDADGKYVGVVSQAETSIR